MQIATVNIKPTTWGITNERALFWKCSGMWFNFSLILCAFITFTFSQLCQRVWVHWCALQPRSNNAGASLVSAQFMNPGPLCTRRLVWFSVCGALPENEFSLKHMPPADSFPSLIWNSNFYNEHQFPVWRGREGGREKKVSHLVCFGWVQLSKMSRKAEKKERHV